MTKKGEPFISHSVNETMNYGLKFARELHAGEVIGLQGDLGAGKTTLVKGMAEAFGIKRNIVRSPTFSLINEYEGSLPFYHMDFYRLEHIREAIEIGTEEYLYGNGVCVIEWPEKIRTILPDRTIWLALKNAGPGVRQINIT